MDAVAAADRRRIFMLLGAPLQHREQFVDILDQQVGRAGELDGEAGIEHVGAGHPLMQEPRLWTDAPPTPRSGRRSRHASLRPRSRRSVRRRSADGSPTSPIPLWRLPRARRRARPSHRAHAPRSRTRCYIWSRGDQMAAMAGREYREIMPGALWRAPGACNRPPGPVSPAATPCCRFVPSCRRRGTAISDRQGRRKWQTQSPTF